FLFFEQKAPAASIRAAAGRSSFHFSLSIVFFFSLSFSKRERGKTHPLDQSTAVAAAPGATPSPSALPLPCDQVAGDETHNTQLKRLNPTTGLAKTREASSPAKDRRRADRRRFEQRERTNPKEERRYSGEETTGAVKVTDGHAISDTTKQGN
ncbi:hypothetical protein LINPERPRIM_LOCUS14632, partial [Linum perenne]